MKCAYWNIRSNVSPGALHLLLFTSPKIYPSTLWKEDLKQLEIFCRKFGLCDVYGCYLVYVIYDSNFHITVRVTCKFKFKPTTQPMMNNLTKSIQKKDGGHHF